MVDDGLYQSSLTNSGFGVVKMYDKSDIETLIENMSLPGVLSILSQVCYEKAEHLRNNYQDLETARTWEKVGRAVGKIKIKTDL